MKPLTFKVTFILKIIYLAMLDLHCCAQAFSSFREWGLFSSRDVQASHCCGSFCCRARALEHLGFSDYGT